MNLDAYRVVSDDNRRDSHSKKSCRRCFDIRREYRRHWLAPVVNATRRRSEKLRLGVSSSIQQTAPQVELVTPSPWQQHLCISDLFNSVGQFIRYIATSIKSTHLPVLRGVSWNNTRNGGLVNYLEVDAIQSSPESSDAIGHSDIRSTSLIQNRRAPMTPLPSVTPLGTFTDRGVYDEDQDEMPSSERRHANVRRHLSTSFLSVETCSMGRSFVGASVE